MKNVILLFLIPLLVTILGNNSRFVYFDRNSKQDSLIAPHSSGNVFILEREVQIVPTAFAYKKHHLWIRAVGVFLIFLPLIFFPFKKHFEKRAFEIGWILRNAGDDIIGRTMRKSGEDVYQKEVFTVLIVYTILINAFITCLGYFFNVAPCLYTLLIYERCINFFGWLI